MKGMLGALIASLLATACCLPPLLFLIFGISFGFLGFLKILAPLRIPLSLLSLGLLYMSWRAYTQKCFTCNIQKRKRYLWGYSIAFIVIVTILLYPEWAIYFLEGNE